MNETHVAILFEKLYMEDISDYTFLIPQRIIIGDVDKKRMQFRDRLSQGIYYNSDIAINHNLQESFYYVEKLEDLMQRYNETDITIIAEKILDNAKQKIYYFDNSEIPLLVSKDMNEFYEQEGFLLDYRVNSNNDLRDGGKISLNGPMDQTDGMPNIVEAYNHVTKHVLCQDKAVKKLLTAIYKSIFLDGMKSNILIYGPTGVGKTAMLEQISKIVDLPMVIMDANPFTIDGYKGKDLDEALLRLYNKADGDIDIAEHGILVFDEIDKKASTGDSSSIAKEGVLDSMLKIVEGTVVEIETQDKEIISFDTSNLTIIFSGAFRQMKHIAKRKKTGKTKIGFNVSNAAPEFIESSKTADYEVEDFIECGMPDEFMGRINCFIPLNSLSKEDIKNILLNSKSSPLRIYKNAFKNMGIDITTQTELIDLVVDKAYKLNTGARGLNKLVNEIFENILFDFFAADHEIDAIEISKEVIEDNERGYQLLKTGKKLKQPVPHNN